jgi:hypothetical protein
MLEIPHVALDKALKVFDSCETGPQYAVAVRYADSVPKLYMGTPYFALVFDALHRAGQKAYMRVVHGERT